VDEVLYFYNECRVDYGILVDHVILQYAPSWDQQKRLFPDPGLADAQRRQALTLTLAEEFLRLHRNERMRFTPLGVAQGWSAQSYASMVRDLEKIGYEYIAIGGLVPLQTRQIVTVLEYLDGVRRAGTRFHLLGVTRCNHIGEFARYGVASFDSTSPLRQAFADKNDNYYTVDGTYPAIRIPQVEANLALKRRIGSGVVSQADARRLEQSCLDALRRFDQAPSNRDEVLGLLREYEMLYDPKRDRSEDYRRVLTEKPWKECPCAVCRALGIQVILFRGAERNRRRGFHNLWVFRKRLECLQDRMGFGPLETTAKQDSGEGHTESSALRGGW